MADYDGPPWFVGDRRGAVATGVAVASSNGMGFAAGALGIAGFFVLLAARFRFARVMREQGFFLAGDSMGGGDVWIGASAGGGGGEFGGLGEGGGGDGGGGGGGG